MSTTKEWRWQSMESVNLRTDQETINLYSKERHTEGKKLSLRDLWGNNKKSNICIIVVPVKEKKE